jgi:archaellum component FlaF (FlaF/FlaG flagellin family)
MSETKVLIGVASCCSALAIVATLVVIPQLYATMDELNLRVHDGVQAFRIETDTAWIQLMDVQIQVCLSFKIDGFTVIWTKLKKGSSKFFFQKVEMNK